MRSRSLIVSAVALVLAACSPSNGSEKKGGPGMGFPPPEVAVSEVKARSR